MHRVRRRGQAALGERLAVDVVRIEVVLLLAVLGADVDDHAARCGRNLHAVLAEVTRHRRVSDVFLVSDRVARGNRQVRKLSGSDAADVPDVPRHASRSGLVDRRGADRAADRHAGDHALGRIGSCRRIRNDVQRVDDLLLAEEVALDVFRRREADLAVHVVGPRVVDLALGAEHLADRVLRVVVLAAAAFHVTTTDVGLEAVGGSARVLRLVLGERGRVAERRLLRRGEQRVRAADREHRLAEEGPRRAVLRLRGVPREHRLRIDVHVVVHVVVQERAGRVALCRPLEVAQRAVVVRVGQAVVRAEVVRRLVNRVVDHRGRMTTNLSERIEPTGAAGARTAAMRGSVQFVAVERAGRVIELLADGGALVKVREVRGRVALAVREVRTGNERDLLLDAGVDGARGQRHVAGRQEREVGGIVVLVLVEAVVGIQLDALVMRVHHEVDDAGDGVGAVHRGGAAGQNVSALNQVRRDLVDVRLGREAEGGARGHAAAVDQHHRAARAEAT